MANSIQLASTGSDIARDYAAGEWEVRCHLAALYRMAALHLLD